MCVVVKLVNKTKAELALAAVSFTCKLVFYTIIHLDVVVFTMFLLHEEISLYCEDKSL